MGNQANTPLAILAGASAVYILTTTAIIIHNAFSPLPFEDQWSLWHLYLAHGRYSEFLFTPHNEHRIAVARLILMIDHYLFHARNLFPLIFSLLAQATTGIFLYRMACRTGVRNSTARLVLACGIYSALFSAQQFPNLVRGIQIPFTMVYCASCGSLLALLKTAERSERHQNAAVWFAACCALALVATYSLANGLLCWPLLILLALWLRLPFRYLLALGLGFVIFTGLYLWGYHTPPQHSSPIETLTHHTSEVFIRAAAVLGSPSDAVYFVVRWATGHDTANARVLFAAACGLIGTVALASGMILMWLQRPSYSKGHAALAHVALFVLFAAVLVGLGRANFPLTSAMDLRYRTPALLFWTVLGAFYVTSAARFLSRLTAYWREALSIAALGMIVGLAVKQPLWVQFSKDEASASSEIQAAIVSNVFDAPVWQKSFPPSGAAILGPVDFLRRDRLSVFSEPWTTWTGRSVDSLFEVGSDARSCIGYFDSATPISPSIRPGWRVSGWAWDRQRETGPGTVILLDASRRIAGVVKNTVERVDVPRAIPEVRSSNVGWRGYVAGSGPIRLKAYLLEPDGHTICALQGEMTPAHAEAATALAN